MTAKLEFHIDYQPGNRQAPGHPKPRYPLPSFAYSTTGHIHSADSV